VAGSAEEFERRVLTTRGIYLADGLVGLDELTASINMIQAHMPLPAAVKVPRPADMLYLAPLKQAGSSRP
jgi:hypothetical protein